MGQFILISIGVFLITILLLVILLLVAKKYLSPSGKVTITINGDKELIVGQGNNLMATLNENGFFLRRAAAKPVVGNAKCRYWKMAERFSTRSGRISLGNKSKITGDWGANAR